MAAAEDDEASSEPRGMLSKFQSSDIRDLKLPGPVHTATNGLHNNQLYPRLAASVLV